MEFDILQDIREMIHGLGEKKPRVDCVKIIQSVLLKQMALLIFHTKQASKKNEQLLIKHILYILCNHKLTLIRTISYFLLKENIHKFTTVGITEQAEDYLEENPCKKPKLTLNDNYKPIDKHFVEAILNLDFNEEITLDPTSVLTSIDFKSNTYKNKRYKRLSTYKEIMKAMVELKLDINITKEDIRKSTEARHIRVNNLSLELSASRYEDFQVCRRKNFQNKKLGDLLLQQVHKYLPPDIKYDKDVKEIFLFLAKDTIACLFDHVYKNRKNNAKKNSEGTQCGNLDNSKSKNITGSLRVEEIMAVTSAFWKQHSSDMCTPFVEDNKFFSNQLIFD